MKEHRHNHNGQLDLFETPEGDKRLYSDIFNGPYRPYREDDNIPVEYTDEIIVADDGSWFVPTRLFGD